MKILFSWGESVGVTYHGPGDNLYALGGVRHSWDLYSWNTFSVTDYGNMLDVVLNDVLIISNLQIENSLGVGNRIILEGIKIGSRANTEYGPIEVRAVPEPSSLSLLLAGGLVALARRRKS